eukprot:scaffold7429_cov417-Prasinococcus_capsulatus_cf.AAC.8
MGRLAATQIGAHLQYLAYPLSSGVSSRATLLFGTSAVWIVPSLFGFWDKVDGGVDLRLELSRRSKGEACPVLGTLNGEGLSLFWEG